MTDVFHTGMWKRPLPITASRERPRSCAVKLRAERDEFAEAISWATRTVGARVTLPALSGVLLEAVDGRLVCRATDLEVAAEISIPVQIDEPGRVLLPGRLLSQLVARFPDGAGAARR
jgi:DNA polymerase III subunit beta